MASTPHQWNSIYIDNCKCCDIKRHVTRHWPDSVKLQWMTIGNITRHCFHWGTYNSKGSMKILPEENTHVKLRRFHVKYFFIPQLWYFLMKFMWNCFMQKNVIRLIIYFCGLYVMFYGEKKLKVTRIKIIFYVSFLYAWHIFNRS